MKTKELDGVTAILATPTYGPADPVLGKNLRVAMMVAANHGLEWVGDASTDRVGWGAARNQVAQVLYDLGGEAQGCMWVDSDINITVPSHMARLIRTAVESKFDILSGVYHQRAVPHLPVFYHYNHKKDTFQEMDDYKEDLIITPGGCGFGFVWTSYDCIKKIAEMKDFDKERGGWFPDTRFQKGGKGEDFAFCSKVNRAGMEVHVDTGIQVDHCGDFKSYNRKDFLRVMEDIKSGKIEKRDPTKVEHWGELG